MLPEESRKEIQRMIDCGRPYREIASRFGVSTRWIIYSFLPREKRRLHCIKTIQYPKLAEWMYQNGVSRENIAEWTGLPQLTSNKILTGKLPPTFEFILKILEKTGMEFEEIFSN